MLIAYTLAPCVPMYATPVLETADDDVTTPVCCDHCSAPPTVDRQYVKASMLPTTTESFHTDALDTMALCVV
jgi:hypothetical protein